MLGNKKIVECVPNFSEGHNEETISAITSAIKSMEGCTLLDVDPGVSINRTVVTFVGDPECVVNGALAAARVAYKMIDMTKHHGKITLQLARSHCNYIIIEPDLIGWWFCN